NRWFTSEARWTHEFVSAFLRCMSQDDGKFVRYFLRRCNRFVMKANSSHSYQQLVLNLNECFSKVQKTFCLYRTRDVCQDRFYALSTFSNEDFSEEFCTAV